MPVTDHSNKPVDVTVFIPTFNGEKYLERILESLERQEFEGDYEILIIDSGSTDQTLEIISRHPSIRLEKIPQSEFGHGKTRNFAAQRAAGKYIVYLSHDAVPLGTTFISDMVRPLKPTSENGADVQAVFGKHIARRNCAPSLKYGIQSVFDMCGPDGKLTIVGGTSASAESLHPGQMFYSDVCAASTTDFLLNVLPYQDLPYAEDMAFARDLINGGYRKAYQPNAVVEHSNDVTLREYPKRMFDETLGMRRVNPAGGKYSIIGAALRLGKETLKSTGKILTDSDYKWWSKPYWVVNNALFVAGKWLGIYRALSIDLQNTKLISKYSLEAERKNSAN